MVLGSLDPRISYETSLYYSTKAVSINYIPGSLNIEPGGWDLANSEFLGDLFGFEYKKQLPPSYSPPGKPSPVGDPDWDEYPRSHLGWAGRGRRRPDLPGLDERDRDPRWTDDWSSRS